MGRKIVIGVLAITAAILAGLPLVARADSEAWAAVFAQANRLYEAGQFAEAAARYEEIVAAGIRNGRVYYNLGNARFKEGHLGLAIVNYERARRLLPRDEDVRANLAFARAQRVDKIEEPNQGVLWQWLTALQGLLTLDETALLAWLVYLSMTALAMVAIFAWRWRPACLYGLGVLAVVLALSLLSFGSKYRQQEVVRQAVIIAPEVNVLSGPGTDFLVEFTVHEGAEFTVEEERGDWLRVRLRGDLEGWVEKAMVEQI